MILAGIKKHENNDQQTDTYHPLTIFEYRKITLILGLEKVLG